MIRRFEVLRETHLGPIQRTISPGDIIWWDAASCLLMINGQVFSEAKNMDFEEAISVLEKLKSPAGENPNPLVKELSSVEIDPIQLASMRKAATVKP